MTFSVLLQIQNCTSGSLNSHDGRCTGHRSRPTKTARARGFVCMCMREFSWLTCAGVNDVAVIYRSGRDEYGYRSQTNVTIRHVCAAVDAIQPRLCRM